MSKTQLEDDKDTQAFLELREKYEEARVTLQAVLQQQQSGTARQRRAVIMAQELDTLPEDTFMYKSVGKAYFLSDKPQLMKELEIAIVSTDEDLKQLKAKREHVEKTLEATESEINELFSQMPSASAQG